MPSQFQNALYALTSTNTANFNKKYGITNQKKPIVKSPSQFELAKLALRSASPVEFNEKYSFSPTSQEGKGRKTRKSKKSSKQKRKQTRRR